jgi:electron transfer flavoprotein beta subunit
MRALVAVKRVVDYAVKVRVSDKSVDLNVKMSMNPFCEIAVEESVRLKERGLLSEVVAITIGPSQCQETLRQALAVGVDRAILVRTDERTDTVLQPLTIAKILAQFVERESPQLVLTGKQSIDGDHNQTGQLLAGLLAWPQATFASKISFNDSKSQISVDREVDTGTQVLSMSLPAVVSTDLRLNTPRFATLPNLMKAKKKPIDVVDLTTLGIKNSIRSAVSKMEDPPSRKGGRILSNVDELVDALRREARVL